MKSSKKSFSYSYTSPEILRETTEKLIFAEEEILCENDDSTFGEESFFQKIAEKSADSIQKSSNFP